MIRVISNHNQPLVLVMRRGRFSVSKNLLPGDFLDFDESYSVSPEAAHLKRKKIITIEIKEESEPVQKEEAETELEIVAVEDVVEVGSVLLEEDINQDQEEQIDNSHEREEN